MSRTRLSLGYVVAYLTVAGLSLLLVPNFALTLLLSNNASAYGDVFPRFVGMTLIGLDFLVFQIVRMHIEQLYSTTLIVRIFFLVVLAALFFLSKDPFFMVVFAIVGVGVVFTGYNYLRERSD
jgi:hypothetical protein